MERYNLYLPEPMKRRLERDAEAMDISVAELVRRILEEYLREQVK